MTGRRVDVLAGGLRPPARTYPQRGPDGASRGLRALASLSLARSVGKVAVMGRNMHGPNREILEAYYGADIGDHMPFRQIEHFLKTPPPFFA